MTRRYTAIITAMAAAAALWSCEVIETPAPVPPEEGDEIVLEVQEQTFATKTKAEDGEETAVRILSDDDISIEIEAVPYGADSVQTRATALTSLPSSLYWEGTTGAWKSETARWASAPASISSGRLSTGKYQTGTATSYNYYVSSNPITFAEGGSTISASNGTDVIAGCTQGATSSTTPSVTLGHVFARTGAITLDTQAGFTLSGVSWKMESTSGSGGTAGTYNIATGEWSGMTALPQTAVSTGSDLYLVPGTYRLTVSYTLTASGQSKTFTKTCNVSLTAGKVHSIIATATGGTIDHELIVSPSGASLDVGERQTFRATYYTIVNGVRDSGTDVTSSASWTTSRSSVATVSAGTVTARSSGSATITATYEDESASATVSVHDVITDELVVTGNTSSINVGGTAQLKATYYTVTNGVRGAGTDVTSMTRWSSDDPSVASVSSSGEVSGLSSGHATFTGEYRGCEDTWTITVKDVITHELELNTSSATIGVGGTLQLTATYYTVTNGVRDAGTDVTSSAGWTTSRASVATVSEGNVTGVYHGTSTIRATYSGLSATCSVIVEDVVTYEFEIYPEKGTISVGDQTYIYARLYKVTNGERGTYSLVANSTSFSFSPSGIIEDTGYDSTVFIVVKAKKGGTVTITGSYQGYTDSCTITVESSVTHSLEVTPASASVGIGATTALTANYYTITDGVKDSGTDVTSSASWSSSSTATATVSAGTVTGTAAGTATITATYSELSASATVTVNGKILEELFFSPSNIQMSVGGTQTAAVMARYSDGTTANVTSVCTAVTPPSAWNQYFSVTRGNTFLTFKGLSSVNGQTYTVSYTYEGRTLTATVSVTVTDHITYEYYITPSAVTLNIGGSQTFRLMRRTLVNGSATTTDDVTSQAGWAITSGSGCASLSGSTVTATTPGSATVQATLTVGGQTVTRTATITVDAPAKLTVVSVTGTWKVGYPSYGVYVYVNGVNAAGGSVQTNTVTESGKTLVTINAMTNGHDETTFTLEETITYRLSDGSTHTYRNYKGTVGVMPGDDWSDSDGLWIRGDNIEPFLFYYRLVAD